MQKILIVEDDADIQDILKNHLIDAGYEVVVASDGVAGIAMFDDTINLILLDIMLPKIDGYGVCEVIRKRSQVTDNGKTETTSRRQAILFSLIGKATEKPTM